MKIREEAAVPSWLMAMAMELFWKSLDALGAGCCAFLPSIALAIDRWETGGPWMPRINPFLFGVAAMFLTSKKVGDRSKPLFCPFVS